MSNAMNAVLPRCNEPGCLRTVSKPYHRKCVAHWTGPNTRRYNPDPDYYFDPSQGGMTESEFFGGDIGDK
jgi:hypothetical protein